MRENEISAWVKSLVQSLGGVWNPIDPEELYSMYQEHNYKGMLQYVRKSLRLDMQLRIGLVNSGGPSRAPAWTGVPSPLPMYGTAAFKSTTITVYFRKQFLEDSEFSTIVFAMAHELCHTVLYGIGHELQKTEEAVDLTAMILGYRNFYLKETRKRVVTILPTRPQTWFERLCNVRPIPDVQITYVPDIYGYLSPDERRFAASLME